MASNVTCVQRKANVQFTKNNLISKIDSLKRNWKSEKNYKSTTGGTPST